MELTLRYREILSPSNAISLNTLTVLILKVERKFSVYCLIHIVHASVCTPVCAWLEEVFFLCLCYDPDQLTEEYSSDF